MSPALKPPLKPEMPPFPLSVVGLWSSSHRGLRQANSWQLSGLRCQVHVELESPVQGQCEEGTHWGQSSACFPWPAVQLWPQTCRHHFARHNPSIFPDSPPSKVIWVRSLVPEADFLRVSSAAQAIYQTTVNFRPHRNLPLREVCEALVSLPRLFPVMFGCPRELFSWLTLLSTLVDKNIWLRGS